jgi:hypothetical protein
LSDPAVGAVNAALSGPDDGGLHLAISTVATVRGGASYMKSSAGKSSFHRPLFIGVAAVAGLTAMQIACSGSDSRTSGETYGGSPEDGTGSIGMQLTLAGGQHVNTVSWTISGGAFTDSGTLDVSGSQGISFLAGGIPPGSGYQITLTATSVDGSVTCAGQSTFSVAARATTNVNVAMQCQTAGSEAGAANISGSTYNCAAWSSVTVEPAETNVGSSVLAAATATGPNPAAFTFAWSAPSGTFDTPNAATTHFTCTTAGVVTLTVTVGDGPVPAGAACDATRSTTTVTVSCDTPKDGG